MNKDLERAVNAAKNKLSELSINDHDHCNSKVYRSELMEILNAMLDSKERTEPLITVTPDAAKVIGFGEKNFKCPKCGAEGWCKPEAEKEICKHDPIEAVWNKWSMYCEKDQSIWKHDSEICLAFYNAIKEYITSKPSPTTDYKRMWETLKYVYCDGSKDQKEVIEYMKALEQEERKERL